MYNRGAIIIGKIQDIINEQKADLKKHIYRYLVTIISAILISLIYFATCDVNINKNEYLKHIFTIMCFLIWGAFVTETLFVHKNESRKWGLLGLFYAVSIVFAIAADVLIYQTVFTDKTNYLISVYILAIIVTFLFISIMRIIRENNLSVEKYFARIIFGLTESRYMAVFLIIFQIIYVVWKPLMRALKKDTEYYGLLYVLLFMFLIGLVVPGINIKSATYISQKARFENALEKDDILLDIVTDKADEEILRNVDFTECMEFYINEYANYIKNVNINGYVLYR